MSRCLAAFELLRALARADTSAVPNDRSRELQKLAQRLVDALPHEVAEEVVLTGSVCFASSTRSTDCGRRPHKRLASRVESLAVKPDRLAERIEEAFTETDPRRAVLVMTELQADTVALARDGPNVNRARLWLAEGARLLGDVP